MFTKQEKNAIKKISKISDIESRLNSLLNSIIESIGYPKEIFDEYVNKINKKIGEKEKHLNKKDAELDKKEKSILKLFHDRETALEILSKEKTTGFPWLAQAFADYYYLENLKQAKYIETKAHPAPVSAEKVREIAKKRRIIEQKLRIAQGIIKYYQDLFPFLEEFNDDIHDEDLIKILSRDVEKPIHDIDDIGIDPISLYLSKEEYSNLSTTEKNQLALDRYWSKRKSKWQIGKDYERYLGYVYEMKGYGVYYQGILEGFDDLGRDLICKIEEQTIIIQCKRWSKHKKIHEKHINQLFGTMVKYEIDNPNEDVSAVLYTTTILSERAKEFAKHLGINISEKYPFKLYPSIKCNISRRNGEKIYHLPFDQQYDRTIIEEERNECYVETVDEAEKLVSCQFSNVG